MPSGAKKRKAAKKKKENHPTHNPNPSSASTHSQGVDKESDAGEVSSPASQDHQSHRNPLTEGEEEENVVPVEREFRIEDESDKKDVSFEHDEAPRKSYDGGSSGSSSGSSSNSSDDEGHGNKSSQAVVDVAPIVDSVKLADSSPRGQAEAVKSTAVEEASGEKAVEPVFQENGEKKPSLVEDKVVISECSKEGASSQREELIIQSVETVAQIPDPKECIAQETDERLALSYNAPTPTADNGTTAPEKEYGVTQPLLAPVPRPVERTSWKGCCGLFEMFSGSGR